MPALLKTILLVFEEMFRYVFPLSEDEQQLADISIEKFTENIDVAEVNGMTTLAKFNNPDVRAAVHLVKFHRHAKATKYLSALFRAWLTARSEPAVIIPIPLSRKRYRERGFNQTELIARNAIKGMASCEVVTDVLMRVRHTAPQTSLSRTERVKNLHDAFAVTASSTALADKHVILFDDVLTTGATLEAAKASLLPLSPASITCVALAH